MRQSAHADPVDARLGNLPNGRQSHTAGGFKQNVRCRGVAPANSLAEVRGNHLSFSRTLTGEERVYLDLRGFGEDAKDYDIRIENRRLGAGVRITADRPLSRLSLWAIRAPLSIEPFIDMKIEPGREFTWRIQYEYYTIPTDGR